MKFPTEILCFYCFNLKNTSFLSFRGNSYLVPGTLLTTFKVLLVIFVNLVVNILLFLEFLTEILYFYCFNLKNTSYLSLRGNSCLVPRTVLTTFKALFLVFVNLVVNILLFFEIYTKNWGIYCFFSKNTYFLYHLENSYLVPYLPTPLNVPIYYWNNLKANTFFALRQQIMDHSKYFKFKYFCKTFMAQEMIDNFFFDLSFK